MCGVTAEPAVAERPAAPAIAPARQPRRRPGALRLLNLAAAVVVSAAVLYAAFFPAPGLPALGPAFNPITGGWTMAADAQVTDRSFRLAGLEQPVRVVLESDGTELQLGLLKTAQLEWQQLPASDPGHDVLLAYAQGVNDRIDEARSTHTLDAMFSLLGYEPKPWTPVDSLLIKGDMTQTLNFTDTPLAMALLTKSLGADLANEWFPTLPPNQQSPYDAGPYARPAIAPIEQMPPPAEMLSGAQPLYDRMAALPAGLISRGGASNNWAVAAGKSAGGGALLAGDPHLHLTLPAIWFQLSMESPGYHVAGVSIPGTPVVLIGHNEHIAWSLTDAQNQQTFFYVEKEDAAHPGMYFWKGDWKAYTTLSYDIPVLGGATQHLNVRWSVHGPVISQRGQTTSVYWTGNLPSQDLSVLLAIDRASDWGDFTRALRGWLSPTHNFVYADDRGNIGLISAGYYPQVAKGQPWLPML